jgi:predicted nucleic acid-binding protein
MRQERPARFISKDRGNIPKAPARKAASVKTAVLVDAGPFVALLSKNDHAHHLCVKTLAELADPLVTVWPAVTEAMYLLHFSWEGQEALWEMLIEGMVTLAPLGDEDFLRMRELMKKYRSLPMDMADAALVRVAEREKIRRVFTLDRKDFSVYRPAKIGKFLLLP